LPEQDLEVIYGACRGLRTLRLSSCAYLRADALSALLPPPPPPPPQQQHVPAPAGRMHAPNQQLPWGGGAAGSSLPRALPHLRELDVSYCPLPTAALADLLARGTHLETLAINGCGGAAAEVWAGLAAPGAPASALRSLSAVGCKKLRACWLGLAPAGAADARRQAQLLQAGMYSPPSSFDTAWRAVPCAASGARSHLNVTSAPLHTCLCPAWVS
jgi:hypothetical protein